MIIWVLSDGIPGHVNQARAIAGLMGKDFTEVPTRLRYKFLRPFLKSALYLACPKGFVEFIVGAAHSVDIPESVPDLIISSGGNTAYMNAVLASRFNCRNIFIGSLRGLPHAAFSAILTLEPNGKPNNIVMSAPPSPLNTSDMTLSGGALTQRLGISRDSLWSMFVGGNGAGFYYSDEDWLALARHMVDLSKKFDCKWLVTTSRRTGLEAEEKLKATLPSEVLAESVWFASNPRPVVAEYLGASSRVFVSGDSMSMIADAVASGLPTYVFFPKKVFADQKYKNALDRLKFSRRLSIFLLASASVEIIEEFSIACIGEGADSNNALKAKIFAKLNL